MEQQKWSDEFLDQLRAQGDTEAEACLESLPSDEADRFREINKAFQKIHLNSDQPPEDAPEGLKAFWAGLDMPELDQERITRGQNAFLEHGVLCVIALLNKSLLEGYSSPPLTKVLSISGDLETKTFRRLMGVLQMVLDVVGDDGFEPHGKALVIGAKLRLLHEGLRGIVRREMPEYEGTFGKPVNHEDMLATLMGFSLLPIEGLRAFSADSTRQQEEDLFYVWQSFGHLMGIPPEAIPVDIADAQAFYKEYARRHFRDANENPDGPGLAAADLDLLESLVPPIGRLFGLKALPRILCRRLMTAEAMERVKVEPVKGHWILKGFVAALAEGRDVFGRIGPLDRTFHWFEKKLCWILLNFLVRFEYRGEPAVIVPGKVADLWGM